jgi:hypothetical protein
VMSGRQVWDCPTLAPLLATPSWPAAVVTALIAATLISATILCAVVHLDALIAVDEGITPRRMHHSVRGRRVWIPLKEAASEVGNLSGKPMGNTFVLAVAPMLCG